MLVELCKQTQIGQFLLSVCNLRLIGFPFAGTRLVGLCLRNVGLQSYKTLKFYVWFWENNVGAGSRIIWCSYTYLNGESLVKLFTALVHPHHEYANMWYLVYKRDSTLLENVLRHVSKLVPGL